MPVSGHIKSFVGLALMITLLTGCKGKDTWTAEEGLPWIPRDLASATAQISSNCPEQVDSETLLDSVMLFQDSLTFFYTLSNKVKGTFDPNAFEAFLIPGIIENIRYNSRLDMHRDSSITMVFNYRDRNGEFVTSFAVGPQMYR